MCSDTVRGHIADLRSVGMLLGVMFRQNFDMFLGGDVELVLWC